MATTALDHTRLQEALALAETSFGLTEPNPRVGCVIGTADGRVLGRGATQHAGGAHAEVMALRDAAAASQSVRGATVWVTLEPCAHHGRTPPCCDALVAAGVARVVVALVDPFPAVGGAGIERLRAAGIDVEMAAADIAAAAHDINVGFFSRVQRQRPWVRMKVAASLDGRTALDNGASQWITGADARRDGHAWRHRASAVLTGVGTVLADDPRLDVRLVPAAGQPMRVVLDSALRTPPTARLLQAPGKALVYAAASAFGGPRVAALREAGAEVEPLPSASPDGRLDLQAVLADLHRRHINELHVEAGAVLNGALLRAGLVDELLVYMAPRLLASGRGIAQFDRALSRLSEAPGFRFVEATFCGDDLRIRARTDAQS